MHLRPLGEQVAQLSMSHGSLGLHCLPLRLGASPLAHVLQRLGLPLRHSMQPLTLAHGSGELVGAAAAVVLVGAAAVVGTSSPPPWL